MNDSTSTPSNATPSPTDGAVVVPPWSCPTWCAQPPSGHPFERLGQGPDSSRTHELDLATIRIQDPGQYDRPWPVTVTLCQEEVVVDGGAGGVVLEPPYVTYGDADLTADEARRLGHALLQGADRLESIAAASTGPQR